MHTNKQAKTSLNKAIREAKKKLKEKTEDKFESNNAKELWTNLGLITQYKAKPKTANENDPSLPNKLNEFYARFDRENKDNTVIEEEIEEPCFIIEEWHIKKQFDRLNVRKAAGPDGVSPRLLKECSAQLAKVFQKIFNWSLQISRVPKLYKKARIKPIPKTINASELNETDLLHSLLV